MPLALPPCLARPRSENAVPPPPDVKILLLFLLALASALTLPLAAQSIRYEVAEKLWDANLGTHRAVVRVVGAAGAAQVRLEWRRRDPRPAEKAVIITDAAGRRIANSFAQNVNAEAGDVTFEPTNGAGEYFVHFLPGNPGGGSFPSAKYLAPHFTEAK